MSIFDIQNDSDFEKKCLETFYFQAQNIPIYKKYLFFLKINPKKIARIEEIPFLPISLFKTEQVLMQNASYQAIFSSSGTTSSETSQHFVHQLSLYEQSFFNAFQHFYGSITDYCILALLPSYLERTGSSLVYMAEHLIKASQNSNSGFYLHNMSDLVEKLQKQERLQQKTLLLGVSFALLDLAEQFPMQLKNTIVMETGGMKGKRKELTRSELHEVLKNAFGVNQIHSEYGMTELLSQAYSLGNEIFTPPAWMRILIRDAYDPFTLQETRKTGGINVIDLANQFSCAFIETQDLGRKINHNQFEVLGRFDAAAIRGCNLLLT